VEASSSTYPIVPLAGEPDSQVKCATSGPVEPTITTGAPSSDLSSNSTTPSEYVKIRLRCRLCGRKKDGPFPRTANLLSVVDALAMAHRASSRCPGAGFYVVYLEA
jgi:hypothetical protein